MKFVIIWLCPKDIEDKKMTSVMATWQCHERDIYGRVIE